MIAVAGGLVGILLMFPACAAFSKFVLENLLSIIPMFKLANSTIGLAAIFTIVVGVVAGLFPVIRVIRMKTTDALRHLG